MEYDIQAKFSHQAITHYNDNSWHHAVGVYDGAVVKLYIDGTLAAMVSAGVIHYVTEGMGITAGLISMASLTTSAPMPAPYPYYPDILQCRCWS